MSQNDVYLQIAIWSQVVSSVLFICVLAWLWFKFIQPAILAAQERYNKQIAEAERHRDEAKAALDSLQGAIDVAARDADLIRQRAETQSTREHDATVAESREAGERAVRNAQGEFARSLASARDALRIELLEKALDEARLEAARRVDANVNARLVDGFVGSLERGDG